MVRRGPVVSGHVLQGWVWFGFKNFHGVVRHCVVRYGSVGSG